MKQEEKQLLLKDLCARLPYGVIVRIDYRDGTIVKRELGIGSLHDIVFDNAEGKPYLRSMSSMTEEEKEEMHNLLSPEGTAIYGCGGISMPMNHYGEFVSYEFMNHIIQYLLENHFDFMGLIPKGLAIEVAKYNNPYKE